MAYKRFDDPNPNVDQGFVLNDAFPEQSQRRSLASVLNRIAYGGGAGTATSTFASGCGTGSTGGVKVANNLTVIINGRWGTSAAVDNIWLPAGTQGAASYCKYLISVGLGTSGTITAGNEGTSSTNAHFPTLPDNQVAVGYFEYAANGTVGWARNPGWVITGQGAATSGTATFYDLVSLPYSDL